MVYRKPVPPASGLVLPLATADRDLARSERITIRMMRNVWDLRCEVVIQRTRDLPPGDPAGALYQRAERIYDELISCLDDHLFLGFAGVVTFCELYRNELQDAADIVAQIEAPQK